MKLYLNTIVYSKSINKYNIIYRWHNLSNLYNRYQQHLIKPLPKVKTMAKAYEFIVLANKSEKRGNIVFTEPMQTIYRENFSGTLDELSQQVQTLKQKLIQENQFEANKGFSVSFFLTGGQRKPVGYDAKRHQISTNYIA